MIRRDLKSDVERDVEPKLGGCRPRSGEIVERSQFRIDRLMPALRRADRPRAAGIVRRGVHRIILPLAKAVPTGWIGRQ